MSNINVDHVEYRLTFICKYLLWVIEINRPICRFYFLNKFRENERRLQLLTYFIYFFNCSGFKFKILQLVIAFNPKLIDFIYINPGICVMGMCN